MSGKYSIVLLAAALLTTANGKALQFFHLFSLKLTEERSKLTACYVGEVHNVTRT
jgi:cytochrome b561